MLSTHTPHNKSDKYPITIFQLPALMKYHNSYWTTHDRRLIKAQFALRLALITIVRTRNWPFVYKTLKELKVRSRRRIISQLTG